MATLNQSNVPLGIGLALVFPIAFIGTLMIADYPGPPGPLGFAEFFGWWTVCVATAYCSAIFLRRFRRGDRLRVLSLAFALALPVTLALLLWVDIQPSTPSKVKRIVEYSLQAVGIPAMIAIAAFVVWAVRRPARN